MRSIRRLVCNCGGWKKVIVLGRPGEPWLDEAVVFGKKGLVGTHLEEPIAVVFKAGAAGGVV